MKVTFLGTGTSQGIPVITCNCPVCRSTDEKDKRFRSSVLIEYMGKVFVIDTGPDFRQQMLREGVQKLDAVLITHQHKDHVAGLDDVRPFNFKQKKAIELYTEKRVEEALKREFAYVFADYRYPGIPEININIIDEKPFEIQGINIIPIRAYHLKLPVLGFRINNFAYITDTNNLPEKEWIKLEGTEVLVLNALRKTSHISHYSLDEAVNVIKKIKPGKAFLTHISHMLGLHDDVQKELPENIHLAYDGLKLKLDD